MEQNGNITMDFDDLASRVEVVYDDNVDYLDNALKAATAKAVEKVRQFNGVAEITLKIKFKPVNDRQLAVTANIGEKLPTPSAAPVTCYVNNRGKLCADDPKQTRIPGAELVR